MIVGMGMIAVCVSIEKTQFKERSFANFEIDARFVQEELHGGLLEPDES